VCGDVVIGNRTPLGKTVDRSLASCPWRHHRRPGARLFASRTILDCFAREHKDGLQESVIGWDTVLGLGAPGMTPDEIRARAADIARSRRAAIICMIAATACFVATLYFWDNAYRGLDVSPLKPAATEPAK